MWNSENMIHTLEIPYLVYSTLQTISRYMHLHGIEVTCFWLWLVSHYCLLLFLSTTSFLGGYNSCWHWLLWQVHDFYIWLQISWPWLECFPVGYLINFNFLQYHNWRVDCGPGWGKYGMFKMVFKPFGDRRWLFSYFLVVSDLETSTSYQWDLEEILVIWKAANFLQGWGASHVRWIRF